MIPEGYKWKYDYKSSVETAMALGSKYAEDVYHREFKRMGGNVVAMKELTYWLSIASWTCANAGEEKKAECFAKLCDECKDMCYEKYNDEKLDEYWSFVD